MPPRFSFFINILAAQIAFETGRVNTGSTSLKLCGQGGLLSLRLVLPLLIESDVSCPKALNAFPLALAETYTSTRN